MLTSYAWEDGEGGLHLSVPGLLKVMGLPDTPENHLMVEMAIHEACGRFLPGVPVKHEPSEVH